MLCLIDRSITQHLIFFYKWLQEEEKPAFLIGSLFYTAQIDCAEQVNRECHKKQQGMSQQFQIQFLQRIISKEATIRTRPAPPNS